MTFIKLTENANDGFPVYVVFEQIVALRAACHRWENEVWPYTQVYLAGGQAVFVKETPEEIGKLADKAQKA